MHPVSLRMLTRHERLLWIGLLVVVATVRWPLLKGLYYRAAQVAAPASTIAWRSDLDTALAEARRTGHPVLVDFSASWCPPCIVMKHEVWSDPPSSGRWLIPMCRSSWTSIATRRCRIASASSRFRRFSFSMAAGTWSVAPPFCPHRACGASSTATEQGTNRDTMPTMFTPKPIGVVKGPCTQTKDIPKGPGAKHDAVGTLEISPDYEAGLTDVEGFSHLFVLWVFDRSDGFELLAMPPSDDRPHGVFATRSPKRPNPIGLTVVELICREGRVLHVRGVDMLDGTASSI
jgi:tRNA (adenine37-N6)-methyltransferase